MVNGYELDTTDEKIINELDNLCGVAQNKRFGTTFNAWRNI